MAMMKMMQQAKDMQDTMMRMQDDLANVEVTGTAGGGMVEATVTCKKMLKNIKISPDAMDPSDPSMVEDLVVAAINDANAKADEKMAEETKSMMSSMGLPSDMKLPF